MAAALEEDLGAAEGHQWFYFGGDLLVSQDISLLVTRRDAKSTKATAGAADVGVVDIAFDDVGADGRAVQTVGHLGGPPRQICQIVGLIKLNRLLGGYHGRFFI